MKGKIKHNISSKYFKKSNMSTWFRLGDNSLFKVATLNINHGFDMALESDAHFPLRAHRMIFEHLLDLGHQLRLAVTSRVALLNIFLYLVISLKSGLEKS